MALPMPQKTYPYITLAVLTGVNVLNYVDRSVLWAVQPLIQKEFLVSYQQIGLLTSTFLWSYMCAAPLIGYLGDRFPRRFIVGIGIFIWSGFTFLTAITHSFEGLMWRHIIVGIGEASYASIAPTLVADLFPVERRGRMLAIFSAGLPFGVAVGYVLGGALGERFGWRAPFMVAGIPGFVLAVIIMLLPEPVRGQAEAPDTSPVRSTVFGLLRNGAFLCATLGLAMYTFAMGGLQAWMPTFLASVRGMTLTAANTIFGAITCFNGIVATLIGGRIGDRLLLRYSGAYYTFSGIVMFISIPLMVIAIYATGRPMLPAISVAEFFLLLNTGPVNAALVNSVNANIRATALAVNIFVIHLLGDAVSPWLMGAIADRTSLPTGFWAAFVAAALSGWLFLYGAKFAPRLRPVAAGTAAPG
jgi:MFS transporter, Spinster family, sphingosine-1-phosphate transporter